MSSTAAFHEVPPLDARLGGKKVPLAEYAYVRLRAAIHEGSFQPGQKLRENPVAEWLGISRTPVREAFTRLLSEGLLVSGPGYGLAVAEPNYHDLREIYAVREHLEGLAARLAADHATEAEVERMWELHAEERRVKNDCMSLARINIDLHQVINFSAHNRYLLRFIEDLSDAVGILRNPTFAVRGSGSAARDEHFEIIRAIDRHDALAAEGAARHHVRQSLRRRLTMITGSGRV